MSLKLPEHTYITTQAQWQNCLDILKDVDQFAIDLESNGLFAYREDICLIQISTRTQDFIVDPHAEFEIDDLADLIEDPAIEKVLHASEYDLILMQREKAWTLQNLFDTMWGARILGHDRIGLANVLEHFFGVKLDKKYQRHNWCQRPLETPALAYAQADTHFLLDLRDAMEKELRERGRWEEAQEIFVEQAHVKLPDVEFTPDSFWSINGVYDLAPRSRAILRELAIFRDDEAYRRDRPHFKVFGNATLLDIADRAPNRITQLKGVKGLSARQMARYGRQLMQAIERGRKADIPKPPKRPKRPPDDVLQRYEALHHWRKETARNRGVASDVVMTREMMWEIARLAPTDSAELTMLAPARHALYANDIMNLFR